jgi:hypothetical protein
VCEVHLEAGRARERTGVSGHFGLEITRAAM